MAQIVIVTATDTGVGKTHVTSALVRALRANEARVGAFKPCETGVDHALDPRSTDAGRLLAALGDPLTGATLDRVCKERFRLPAAPLVAARAEGRSIDLTALTNHAASLAASLGDDGVLFIEGAGGLLVPLTDDVTFADWLTTLPAARLLIVARAGLGTINHTLLTIEAARSRKLDVAGIVTNDAANVAPTDPTVASNGSLIAQFSGVPVLAELAHGEADRQKIETLLRALGFAGQRSKRAAVEKNE